MHNFKYFKSDFGHHNNERIMNKDQDSNYCERNIGEKLSPPRLWNREGQHWKNVKIVRKQKQQVTLKTIYNKLKVFFLKLSFRIIKIIASFCVKDKP